MIFRNPSSKPSILITLGCVCLSGLTTACGSKNTVKEADLARYEALEAELIEAKVAVENRLRAEMQLAEKLQRLELERQEKLAELSLNENFSSETADSAIAGETNAIDRSVATEPPVVTPIVVAVDDEEDALWNQGYLASPITGETQCLISSNPVVVNNGTIVTEVKVIISSNEVMVRTDAAFDTSAVETGFRVDAGLPIAFDQFHNELTALVDTNYARLLEALLDGSTLTVSFAYQPQLSNSDTHVVDISLASLPSAIDDLTSCEKEFGNIEDDQLLPTSDS